MQLRRDIALACLLGVLVLTGRATAHPHDLKVMRLDEVVTELTTCTIPCDFGDSLARVTLWNDTILFNNALRWNMVVRKNAVAAKSAGKSTGGANALRPRAAVSAPSGNCGGDLPSCSIMMRESGGNIRARNASGAAGKWQIMPGTWNGYGGYASAADAPEWVQDAKARSMAPCNWVAPNYCGG
jgi:hypothetical protein